MRQVGILAAAGLYALDHHVTRLREDHDNAKHFALQLQQIPSVYVDPDRVDTNVVMFEVVRSDRSTQELIGSLQGHRGAAERHGRASVSGRHPFGRLEGGR